MITVKDSSKMLKMLSSMLKRRYVKTGITLMATRHSTPTKTSPPRSFLQEVICDINVYSILENSSNLHLIYLHGGAYVQPGDGLHYRLLKRLAKTLPASVYYIDYPLAPQSNVQTTTSKTVEVINHVQDKISGDIWILGDSAGAGLALAIANQLNHIKGYMLLSPWMDVSLSNPSLKDDDCTDGFFTTSELRECGRQYAHNSTMSALASPLYQTNTPHNNIHIFSGTADLLHPDIIRYEKQFPSVQVYVTKGAPHVFCLFPFTSEQKDVIQFLKQQTKSR